MALTAEERAKFRADQLAELDRMTEKRQTDMLEPPNAPAEQTAEEKAQVRAKITDQWARKAPEQLRVRVNVDLFGSALAYSSDSDYSAAEKAALNAGWKAGIGRKAEQELPAILAEDAQMASDGISLAMRQAILRNR